MKVVAINGSPRKDGNCAQMLEVLGKVLEQEGIEFEVCQPGARCIRAWRAITAWTTARCAACRTTTV
ncbi:MAG: NAD(P)H-dependent oxidoreductase [Butyricicoccaceae bacterium]